LKPDININNIDNNNQAEKINHGAEIENLIKEYKEKYGSDEELEKMLNDYNNNLNINQPDANIENKNNINNNNEPIYQPKKSNNLKTNIIQKYQIITEEEMFIKALLLL